MIKAIETVYDGYRFRSRLEARWAVFFKTLGIPYKYEKEGYDLDGTYYLPDFWLPEQKCWIEIKGQHPTNEEHKKCELLTELTQSKVFILFGNIPNPDNLPESLSEHKDFGNMCYAYGLWGDEQPYNCYSSYCLWSDCWECNKLMIRDYEYGGGWCCQSYPGANPKSDRLIKAYTAAGQARFEHGENGR